ncbi:hypothetical protein [Streptomyces buecherae]|uniref:Type II toxin-antitoxin system PemK/MazF family toxin n=1 Tax=Streptomyces buecherae TaxID=2763006 RepID=A0A7H8N6P7_9ACTN|nr:hypothetical protein [Streptomyces buecherae]MBC3991659.1 type II toxin-antitoxin system PemK/MazF family toxin [Streptomyces buecherae]QKW50115.1 hypothetical protein HUT08_11835 [Streptomyces buecherae]
MGFSWWPAVAVVLALALVAAVSDGLGRVWVRRRPRRPGRPERERPGRRGSTGREGDGGAGAEDE